MSHTPCLTAEPVDEAEPLRRTDFPVIVGLAGEAHHFRVWQGEHLPDQLLAYDVETAAIEGRAIPKLALATVYGDAGISDTVRFVP